MSVRSVRKIEASFGLAILLVAIIGVVSFRNTRNLIDGNHRLSAHTQQVIGELEAVRLLMADLQFGMRTYARSGGEQYLKQHEDADSEIRARLKRLHELSADDPDEQGHFAVLDRRINQRLLFSQEVVDTRKNKGAEAAEELLNTDRGKNAAADVAVTLAESVRQVSGSLQRQAGNSERRATNTIVMLAALVLLALGLFAAAFYLIRRDIFARQQADQALRESQERYQELFENANDIVFTLDLDGYFTSSNRMAETVTGYQRSGTERRHFDEVVAPEHVELARQMLERKLKDRKPTTYELEIIAKDGHRVPLEISTRLMYKDGIPIGVQGIARDVTHRKQAEEALRDGEERFRNMFEEAPVAYHEIDTEGIVRRVNRAECELLGFKPEEMLGKPIWDFVMPEERDKSRDAVRRKTSGIEPLRALQREYQRRDGTRLVLEVHEKLIRDKQGAIVGVRSALLDITERTRAEQALIRERNLLDALMSNLPDHIYFKDRESKFVRINRAQARWIGLRDAADAVGKRDFDFFGTEHAQQAYTDEQEMMRSGAPLVDQEEKETWPDGRETWVSTTKMPVRDETGLITGIVGISHDITQRKRTEQELARRTNEITLLSELGSLLQACMTKDEAYNVISKFSPTLFPTTRGAIHVLSASRNLVESVVSWGEGSIGEQVFSPDNCWALRSGRLHFVNDSKSPLLCRHLSHSVASSYLCVPMMAQGEALGILHLECGPQQEDRATECLDASKQQLALTLAETVALALANLHLRDTLRLQSIRDPLTGLYNRRYMEESLEREMRRALRNGRQLGAIMLDLDHFKRYNDTFGHDAGDAVLKELGSFLQTQVRGEDIACRYGGEEFVLILPDASLEATEQRAEALREGAKRLHVRFRGESLGTVTLSLGVALFPEHGTTTETLLRAADEALYLAKANGRDQIVVWKIGQPKPEAVQ